MTQTRALLVLVEPARGRRARSTHGLSAPQDAAPLTPTWRTRLSSSLSTHSFLILISKRENIIKREKDAGTTMAFLFSSSSFRSHPVASWSIVTHAPSVLRMPNADAHAKRGCACQTLKQLTVARQTQKITGVGCVVVWVKVQKIDTARVSKPAQTAQVTKIDSVLYFTH